MKQYELNPESRMARRYYTPWRSRELLDQQYQEGIPEEERARLFIERAEMEKQYIPEPSGYTVYFGELHGHSCLSDGRPTPDEYYRHLRDVAKFDFGTLTDHTHGGIGHDTLLGHQFEVLREAAIRYNEPGKFTTLLAYEIEADPYYCNMVVYHDGFGGEVEKSKVPGEYTAEELDALLKRGDRIAVPHDTYMLAVGADLETIPAPLFSPLIQLYSRGNSCEYFGNPQFDWNDSFMCEGGFWHDALKRGARMGVIGGSDDHGLTNGMILEDRKGLSRFPGITGVLAKENTNKAIFEAIKARRCYCFMGGRMYIDFRVNGHVMGEEFASEGDRYIYYKVSADAPVKKVTLVKNCRDYIVTKKSEFPIIDYRQEQETDCYYLRVELEDGRCGWTSPIWVNGNPLP